MTPRNKQLLVFAAISGAAALISTILFKPNNLFEVAVIILASPTAIFLFLKLLKPILNLLTKPTIEKQKKINKEVAAALNSGKKPFKFTKQQHVVYAHNLVQAQKIFNKNVKPFLDPKSNKRIDYISASCNNLNK